MAVATIPIAEVQAAQPHQPKLQQDLASRMTSWQMASARVTPHASLSSKVSNAPMQARGVLLATRSLKPLLHRHKRLPQQREAATASPKGEAKTVVTRVPDPRPQMGAARPSRSEPAASPRDPASGRRTWCVTSIHEEHTSAAAPKMDATSNTEASTLPKSWTATNGKRNS